MKLSTTPYLLLSLIALLAASCGPVTPAATATATKLSVPSVTPLPPALSLSPSNGPDKEVSFYTLRSWTEDDYTRIVKSLDNLVGKAESQISYLSVPDYLVTLQQERLLKFPNSSARNDILWNILFNKPETMAIPGMQAKNDLMSSIISDLLSQGIQVADLIHELENYDLQVIDTLTMEKMIGNGEDALVLLIEMYGVDAPLVGVFVIFSDGERFHVQKIRDWEASEAPALGRYFEIYNVGDTNRNGLSEVVVQVQAHSGGIAKENMDHIEWSTRSETFQNMSFLVFWQNCDYEGGSCEGDWEFTTFDSQSVLVIRSYWPTRKDCPVIASQHTFIWNGMQYVSKESEILPPSGDLSAECRLAWAETAIWLPSSAWNHELSELGWKNDLAISIVEESLMNWPVHADEIWGPASRDYFKLQLGIWYDLRGEKSKAEFILRQVASKPYQAEYDFISRLASLYLERRISSGRIRACLEMEDMYLEELRISIPEPSFFGDTMLKAWGIIDRKGSFCDVYDMLPVDLKAARVTSPEALMQWLDKTELIIYQEITIDLNHDELEDHVILLDTTDSGSLDVWAFLGTPTGYEAAYINEIWSEDEQSKLNIQSIEIDNDIPVHLILSDEEDLVVFRVTPNFSVENLFWEFGVQSFEIYERPVSISVHIDTVYDGKRTIDYVWNTSIQNFVKQEDRFVTVQAKIEEILYIKEDYQEAIDYIDNYLRTSPSEPQQAFACSADTGCKYLPEWYIPYFRYLRGLAYEQLGQNEQARQAYFELWQDFPENVFGMVASLKLAPITP